MLDKSDVERGKKADFIVLAENISKSVLCMMLFFIHLFFFPFVSHSHGEFAQHFPLSLSSPFTFPSLLPRSRIKPR